MQNTSLKTFHRKPYFAKICEFRSNILSKIVWGNRFSFISWSRPLDFIFSEDFSIWKLWFALQIDIVDNSVAKNNWIWCFSKNTILQFSVKYEFGTKRYSSCSRTVFMNRFYLFLLKNDHFLGFQCIFQQFKTERKFFRQSWTKHLETFSLFRTIPLHDKWNGTRLLSPQSACTSWISSCRTT